MPGIAIGVSPTLPAAAPAAPAAPSYYVILNGISDFINCGKRAGIDNLAANTFTVDLWSRLHQAHTIYGRATVCKDGGMNGWAIGYKEQSGTPRLSTTTCHEDSDSDGLTEGGYVVLNQWQHIVFAFDASTGRDRLAVDGVWADLVVDHAAAGPAYDDSMVNLYFGVTNAGNYFHHGDIAWIRFSSGLRFTPGADFTPPSCTEKPTADASTIELWTLNEGAGAIVAASVNSANNGAGSFEWGTF